MGGARGLLAVLACHALVVACSPTASQAPSAAPSVTQSSPPASPEPSPSPSAAAVEFPLELTDANGNDYTFEAAAVKFGDMWDGGKEALADLGLSSAVQAYAPPAAGVFWNPTGQEPAVQGVEYDVEKWAAAEPDVILTAAPGFPGYDDVVEDAMENVFYLHFPPRDTGAPAGAEAFAQNLRWVGQLADRPTEAEAAIARYERIVAALEEAAPEGAADTEILMMFPSEDGTYWTFPLSNVFCATIAEHGLGQCVVPPDVATKTDSNVFEVSAEAILELDPAWIAYIEGDSSTRTDPVWPQLAAVESGQVFDVAGRYNCCSLRQLGWALQNYAFNVWGDEGGIADPGPMEAYDPTKSPLATGS
jgi:ABC-type Fe3+-hydroxamate transport system substrate-binding protein